MTPLELFSFQKNPFENFIALFEEMKARKIAEPNAMTLATINDKNQPTVRVVLFKGFYGEGFGFFTNYDGRKAQEIAKNPNVAVNFFWPEVAVQVRIDGRVEKLSRTESESYFNTRPRLSQIGAWASHQSAELKDRIDLEKRIQELELKFEGQDVPCPPNWGGYKILAREIEFWFGVEGRIHHRYVYSRQSQDTYLEKAEQVQWKRWMRHP